MNSGNSRSSTAALKTELIRPCLFLIVLPLEPFSIWSLIHCRIRRSLMALRGSLAIAPRSFSTQRRLRLFS